MSNLTVSVDDELIKRARVRAIQQGTSLSAKVREFLAQYVSMPEADGQKQRDADTQRLLSAIDRATTQAQRSSIDALSNDNTQRQTLREEMYAGDFRASGRSTHDDPGTLP